MYVVEGGWSFRHRPRDSHRDVLGVRSLGGGSEDPVPWDKLRCAFARSLDDAGKILSQYHGERGIAKQIVTDLPIEWIHASRPYAHEYLVGTYRWRIHVAQYNRRTRLLRNDSSHTAPLRSHGQ